MGKAEIKLEHYDTVVAVTQQAINEGIADFLAAQHPSVHRYYKKDKNDNLVPYPGLKTRIIPLMAPWISLSRNRIPSNRSSCIRTPETKP